MAIVEGSSAGEKAKPLIIALQPRNTIAEAAIDPAKNPAASRSVIKDLLQLCAGIWATRQGKAIASLLLAIVIILIANMAGQVWLNRWNGGFFDAIEQRDIDSIRQRLIIFLGIVACLLVLVVAQTWLHETIKLRVREWLTHRLFDVWLVAGRPYRLGESGAAGVNPDQRMQEDARHFSELSTNLGIGLTQQLFLLVTFVGVLWQLSSDVVFDMDGMHIAIPGYMVWCAVIYASVGSYLTWLVGRRLVGLNATRYACEAELRYNLVRVNERAEAIALYRGEEGERRNLNMALTQVLQVTRDLIFALARLTWITSGYGWLAIVVPALVALPGYLQGRLTLGGLMVVIGAFNQVQGGLRWFVDSAASIADWRATLYRVAVFDESLRKLDEVDPAHERIEIGQHPHGNLSFEHVSVLTAFGKVVIDNANEEIKAGERVLIMGDSGAGKSTLFRAISGLWPWGHGRILLPPREQMMFMPQYPYLPLGTLRTAVCYPEPPQKFAGPVVSAAFVRAGLGDLLDMLDVEERWDRVLSQGQQQLLAFARLLLHKPTWIFLDEATSAMDVDNQVNVMKIFDIELKGASVVSIGHRQSLELFHNRLLQLQVSPEGAHLSERKTRIPTAKLQDRLTSWFSNVFLADINLKNIAKGKVPDGEQKGEQKGEHR